MTRTLSNVKMTTDNLEWEHRRTMSIKEQFARWFVEKYLPGFHLHTNPKIRKERPTPQDMMSPEKYMAWRRISKGQPDPKDFESIDEFEHEMEKFRMKVEAQREGDR